MNASSSDVLAPASTELTTPTKSTPKPTSAIAAAARQVAREASVPIHTNMPPTAASAACACSRTRIGPLKSTSSSIANEPNAAKVAIVGLPMTLSLRANIAGMTRVVQPARRSAERPRSRVPSHCTGCIRDRPVRPVAQHQVPTARQIVCPRAHLFTGAMALPRSRPGPWMLRTGRTGDGPSPQRARRPSAERRGSGDASATQEFISRSRAGRSPCIFRSYSPSPGSTSSRAGRSRVRAGPAPAPSTHEVEEVHPVVKGVRPDDSDSPVGPGPAGSEDRAADDGRAGAPNGFDARLHPDSGRDDHLAGSLVSSRTATFRTAATGTGPTDGPDAAALATTPSPTPLHRGLGSGRREPAQSELEQRPGRRAAFRLTLLCLIGAASARCGKRGVAEDRHQRPRGRQRGRGDGGRRLGRRGRERAVPRRHRSPGTPGGPRRWRPG